MSNRTLTATILNNLDDTLVVTSKSLEHGKWILEPQNVTNNSSQKWEAGNRDGSAYGTKGSVKYTCQDVTFEIRFDKPFGSGKTVVDLVSSSSSYAIVMTKDDLQHHESTCTIAISKH